MEALQEDGPIERFSSVLGRQVRGEALALVAQAFLALFSSTATEFVVRDKDGRRVDPIERGIGGDLVRCGADGRRIGTAEQDHGDWFMLRERDGRPLGTVEPRAGGGYVVREPDGRRGSTIKPAIGGDLVIRDGSGC